MSAPYYTPQRPYFPPSNHPSASSSASTTRAGGASGASGATGAPSFTPAMRDRQARGKDPYSPHDSPSDSDLEFEGGAGGSPSRGGGGSIPGTRLHFTRMLCGFDEEPMHPQQSASSSSARRDPRRRSAGGDRMGRH
ncbi:hypothetical protein CaCOL14_000941 [Colletotrichum acutatum]